MHELKRKPVQKLNAEVRSDLSPFVLTLDTWRSLIENEPGESIFVLSE